MIHRMKEALDFQVKKLADLRAHEEQALQDTNAAEATGDYYLDQLLKDGAEIVALKEQWDTILERERTRLETGPKRFWLRSRETAIRGWQSRSGWRLPADRDAQTFVRLRSE